MKKAEGKHLYREFGIFKHGMFGEQSLVEDHHLKYDLST